MSKIATLEKAGIVVRSDGIRGDWHTFFALQVEGTFPPFAAKWRDDSAFRQAKATELFDHVIGVCIETDALWRVARTALECKWSLEDAKRELTRMWRVEEANIEARIKEYKQTFDMPSTPDDEDIKLRLRLDAAYMALAALENDIVSEARIQSMLRTKQHQQALRFEKMRMEELEHVEEVFLRFDMRAEFEQWKLASGLVRDGE